MGRGSIGRYGAVGLTGVVLDVLLFTLLLRAGMVPVLATVIGTLAGITNNYIWNSVFNFRMKLSGGRGIRFVVVGVAGLITATALLQALISLGIGTLEAKLFTIPVVASSQFLVNASWTFSNSRETSGDRRVMVFWPHHKSG